MFAVPDLTVPPLVVPSRPLPLATLARTVAADPGRWQHLLRYEQEGPCRIELTEARPGCWLWLCGWLPGQRASLGGVFVVVVGLICELDGSIARPVRAGQTRICGPDRRPLLANLGSDPAVTVHAE
jgi:hypothetical protein